MQRRPPPHQRRGVVAPMSATALAAFLLLVMLLALAVFQLALIVGAPLGHLAWGGQHRVLPARLRIGSAVSVVLYAFFAAIVLARLGMFGFVAEPVAHVAMWVLFAYFVLGIGLNAISRSKPERALMTPVCIVLAGASLVVALA